MADTATMTATTVSEPVSKFVPLPAPAPIDEAYKPAAEIQHLAANTPVEDILATLDRDGGCIIDDFVNADQIKRIDSEIEASGGNSSFQNDSISIVPKETILTPGLVGKSDAIAAICESPLLSSLRNEILAETFTVLREEGLVEQRSIDPLLSISVGFNIGPGAPRQRLHRDDNIHNTKHEKYDMRRVSQLACLIAGVETKRENGATMFVPGSHRWDDSRQPKLNEICFAEMKPGSALLFLGGAYHGGGHNSTLDRRTVYGLFFIRGFLRQEENQFLAIPRSKVLTMSKGMQALLGYKQPNSVLGIVDNRDPMSDLENVLRAANM